MGKFGIKLGQVHFGLNYDNVKNILRIKIYEAKDLPAADEGIHISRRVYCHF